MYAIHLKIIFLATLSLKASESARILGAVFTPSYSHQSVFQPIWRELSQRGHQVVVLTTDPVNDPALTNLTEIDLGLSYEVMRQHKTDDILSAQAEGTITRIKKYLEALSATADAQLGHPDVQKLIHNQSERFDLLMVEAIFPTQMALAWRFQVPFIGLISLDAPPRLHEAVGNPIHPILYPDYNLPFFGYLSFFERVISCLVFMFSKLYLDKVLYAREDLTVKKFFGDEVPALSDIQKNMSLLYVSANPVFHNVRPLGPNTISIGSGMHVQKPKPLQKVFFLNNR